MYIKLSVQAYEGGGGPRRAPECGVDTRSPVRAGRALRGSLEPPALAGPGVCGTDGARAIGRSYYRRRQRADLPEKLAQPLSGAFSFCPCAIAR